MSGELYDLALAQPWCITDEALEAMLSIAARDPLPDDEIARRMHGPKTLALRQGPRHDDSRTMRVRQGVATIPIDGPIYRYADMFTRVSGGVTTDTLARDLGTALDDPTIGAILLMVDSPGGEATGINELADTIYQARGRKPIVAYIEGYGASAAYWIASAADLVVADDTALVGSIGTVMGVPDPAKRVSRTIDFVSTQSPKKRPDPTTDAGRAYLQTLVDDMTAVFVAKVARNRTITEAAVLAVAGGMLVGQKAVDAGLVDMLGSEEQIHAALAAGALPMLRKHKGMRRDMAMPMPMHTAQEERMKVSEFISGIFTGAQEAGITLEADPAPAPALAAPQSAPPQQPDPEVARLRDELTRLRAEQIQKDAQAFAAGELAANRALPAERDAIVALYARAAALDSTDPPEGGQPSNVALVQAAYQNRPAHTLTKPTLPSVSASVLPATPQSEEQASLQQAEESARAYARRANGTRAA